MPKLSQLLWFGFYGLLFNSLGLVVYETPYAPMILGATLSILIQIVEKFQDKGSFKSRIWSLGLWLEFLPDIAVNVAAAAVMWKLLN
jgi:hypothetical protein